MPLIRWEPFKEFDRFFDDELFRPLSSRLGWDLAVDVYEDKDSVVAEMNLPGIDPDALDISFEEGYLRVSGSRQEEKETKKKDYHSKEIRRGSFERLARIPRAVDADKAKATYKDGVLKVVMPRKAETRSRQVKVRVEKKK
ncbi:hypothetical protein AMJ57_05135 [Parcubacteria bacterium SG8_24]|nr:MAG: hypothetical protein AMJ57_05135 [Parcubacteria bacterium SG8_24]